MFKIAADPSFAHKVKVRVPVDGGFADQEFTARFRVVPWDDVKALDHDPAAQLRLIWIGAEGIADDAGAPLPWSDALRDQLIGILFVRLAVLRTYVDAVTGAVRGN